MERHRRERDKLPFGYQHARRDIQDTLNDLVGDDDDGDIGFKMRRLTRSVIDAVYEAVGKVGVAPVFDVVGPPTVKLLMCTRLTRSTITRFAISRAFYTGQSANSRYANL